VKNYFKQFFEWKVFFLTLALVAIGLVSVYSATYDAGATSTFYRQALWALAGLVAMTAASFLPLKVIQRIALPSYVFVIVLLITLLLVGKTISGSRSWFGFGGYGIQPSEFAKLTTILTLGVFFARRTTRLETLKHLIAALGIVALPMLLVLSQPDLGTAIIFLGMALPILYWAGASNFVLAAVLSPILVAAGALFGTTIFVLTVAVSAALLYVTRENRFTAAVVFGLTLFVGLSVQTVYERLPAYQQKRIMTFLDPEIDPQGAGYNVLQSKVAIGSGGFFGKGYLRGTQTQLNFIPEQWTDFIFCVPGEEFGFLGASLVLLLFAALFTRGVTIAALSKNKFGSTIAIGITAVLALHTFINIGMSMGLMPVIGIPLPFMSYGGSALLANMTMAGLLMNVYAHRKEY
jgi:rod shape determining protein RodA